MRQITWAACALLLGCGSSEPSGAGAGSAETTAGETPSGQTETNVENAAEEPEGGTVEGRWFIPTGSPPPQACEAAEDCMGDTIPDAEQPCCNDPYSLSAYARAYRDAVGAWRQTHCADVTCPPPPSPSLPPDCAFEMRCAEGRCANSCE